MLTTICTLTGMVIPTIFQMYISVRENDQNTAIECMAHLTAVLTGIVKIINIYINRENFRKLLTFVVKNWEELKMEDEIRVLDEITAQGSRFAQLYRSTLVPATIIFLLIPLLAPVLDIVIPLNETRTRQQIFKVNYLVIDTKTHFFFTFLHLSWATMTLVLSILAIDSLYILLIHHTSGLLALSGYRVKKAVKNDDLNLRNDIYEKLKRSVDTHNKAIQFYNILQRSSQSSYLIQVGLNMVGLSVTAVQTVTNMDNLEVALRSFLFFGAEQLHLFIISIPGQVLLDHCLDLSDDIYSSKWYNVPVEAQKVIQIMQLRSNKPCVLSAGGIYIMNVENFGGTFKACMSYCTMLLSLWD